MRCCKFAVIILAACSVAAAADRGAFTGRVVGVVDGDTIDVLTDGNVTIRVRFHGIDAPERAQPYGSRAKQFASEQCFGRSVTIHQTDVDRNDRAVGEVILPDGRNLNVATVEAGLAWWYVKYAPNDARLQNAEAIARAAHRGLWADPHAIPPWEWRKGARGSGPDEARQGDPPARSAPPQQFGQPLPLMQQVVPQPALATRVAPPPAVEADGFWLTTSSRKRHNSTCRYFQNSDGRPCGPNEGTPCKICGG
jgi:micrococcal nuclease